MKFTVYIVFMNQYHQTIKRVKVGEIQQLPGPLLFDMIPVPVGSIYATLQLEPPSIEELVREAQKKDG